MGKRTAEDQISVRATPEFKAMLERIALPGRKKNAVMLAGLVAFDRMSPDSQDKLLREVTSRIRQHQEQERSINDSAEDIDRVIDRAADASEARDPTPQQKPKKKRDRPA